MENGEQFLTEIATLGGATLNIGKVGKKARDVATDATKNAWNRISSLFKRGGKPGSSVGGKTVNEIWGKNRTILENLTSKKVSIERVPKGTRAQADADFDALNLSNVHIISKDRRMGTLPDGTNVIVRPSRDGRPTIEFQKRTGKNGKFRTTREIRYGDQE